MGWGAGQMRISNQTIQNRTFLGVYLYACFAEFITDNLLKIFRCFVEKGSC